MTMVSRLPADDLLEWYQKNRRELPWRKTQDPWLIWVSEIMLQQTRVDTVIPYYERFIQEFPTVHDLAAADRQQLLKLWEGLGYYSRARNLQDSAREVSANAGGRIPDTMEEIIKLKGIGPYTAAAILSIAYNKPYAAVDGNVLRVVSRFCGIEQDIRRASVHNEIRDYVTESMDRNHPGDFNQALMELGATVCTPSAPDCRSCPLSGDCRAYRMAATDRIPWKSPAGKVPLLQIGVGLIREGDRVLIALRPESAMLGGLWEFPGGKQEPGEELRQTVQRELKEELGVKVRVLEKFAEVNHTYSHMKITLHAYWCRITPDSRSPVAETSQEIRWVTIPELQKYPFPKANKTITRKLLEDGFPELSAQGNGARGH